MKKNKLKINFVLPMLSTGGGVKVVYELSNRLYAKGYDVEIYSSTVAFWNKSLNIQPVLSWLYMTFRNIFFRKKDNWFNLKVKVHKPLFLQKKNIREADFTIATSWQTAYFVNSLSNDSGKKIYFIQGHEVWGGVNSEIVHKTYSFNMKIITISKWLSSVISKYSNNIVSAIIYPAIDTTVFYPDKLVKKNKPPSILTMYK